MKQQTSPMQLLVSIAQRGDGGALMRQYGSFHLDQHFQSTGHGTAASHLLDTLGFGTSERDILLTIGPKDRMQSRSWRSHRPAGAGPQSSRSHGTGKG